MIKRTIFILLFSLVSTVTFAQRWAYVDTEYILTRLPKYREAQTQLDKMSRSWQGEIEKLSREYDAMKVEFERDKVLLTKDLIEDRQLELDEKQKEIESLQQAKFGPEGELISQRKKLVKPIQDQVFNAVQAIAKKKRLDAIFDKSSDLIMLYYNKNIDVSDDVLKMIKEM